MKLKPGSDPPRARPDAPLPFTERVYALVRHVPHGRIVSYGGAAALLGHPRAARGVGGALSALPDDTDVPWWRVVNRNGEISIKGPMHGAVRQRMLLEAEGVRFGPTGRIDWARFGWSPEPDELPPGLTVEPAPPGPEGVAGEAGGWPLDEARRGATAGERSVPRRRLTNPGRRRPGRPRA